MSVKTIKKMSIQLWKKREHKLFSLAKQKLRNQMITI